jgi:hypothetical protein
MTSSAGATFARRLRVQGGSGGSLGSALYSELMERAAVNAEQDGIVTKVLLGHEDDPGPSALALRLFGTLHRLALSGRAPELAAHYPSCGGDGDAAAAWSGLLAVVERHFDEVHDGLDRPVQTNEVGRCAALLGAFLVVADETGLPLRCLEAGASAGLNLRWPHYRYQQGEWAWGDPPSPLVLNGHFWPGPLPPARPVDVAEVRGCDPSPIDPTSEDGRTTLLSFVWPDQLERFARIRAALDVAVAHPVVVDAAPAEEWLIEQLASPVEGVATVVFHSIVMQYLTDEGRATVFRLIEEAGDRATPSAPLAWLSMEPAAGQAALRLVTWPGGTRRRLANCGFHGRDIQWLEHV